MEENNFDSLLLDSDGSDYLKSLKEKLNNLLTSCQTINEVEERITILLPQVGKSAILNVNKSRSDTLKSRKVRQHSTSGTARSGALAFTSNIKNFSVNIADKLGNLVKDGGVGYRAENEVTKFKGGLIDYVITHAYTLACRFVTNMNNHVITRKDITTAMNADDDLLALFVDNKRPVPNAEKHPILSKPAQSDKSIHFSYQRYQTCPNYLDTVKTMVQAETSFIKDLKLIIKVFKSELDQLQVHKSETQIIFGNIEEIFELSTTLLTSLEDTLEVAHDDEIPYIGLEIFELIQAEEFNAYETFTFNILSIEWKQAFENIILNQNTRKSLHTAGQHFDMAVEYLLPVHFINVIRHFFEFFDTMKELHDLSQKNDNKEDESALRGALSILNSTYKKIENLFNNQAENLESLIKTLDSKNASAVRAMLDKLLDIELEHERNLPIVMPSVDRYRFAEPDTEHNIKFEENVTSGGNSDPVPKIKSATLIKLVERLTYHKYNTEIVETFLNTYRSFISHPTELLSLLIERFDVPEPTIYDVYPELSSLNMIEISEAQQKHYKNVIKRFRQEYQKPVKMRVINVFKAWVRKHYYDFQNHPELLKRLHEFLDETYDSHKMLRSAIDSIRKRDIEQKKQCIYEHIEIMKYKTPPIMWHTVQANEYDKFDILTLHPVEFARQLTLIEFDLFKAIKPSELINVQDLHKSRNENKSPNLSRLTSHFTLISYWLRKCIVEAEDFDHRVAIFLRAIEIMIVLNKFNNFTGLLIIGSAIESAPIKRLRHTQAKIKKNEHLKALEEYTNLNKEHQNPLRMRLRNLNPPCIPYLGAYQTLLIHAKEGNKTFIDEIDNPSPTLSNDNGHSSVSNSPATPISPLTPFPRTNYQSHSYNKSFFGGCSTYKPQTLDSKSPTSTISPMVCQTSPPVMINFKKQRIRAGIVAEIGRFQHEPYRFQVQEEIKRYIESIEISMKDFVSSLGANFQDVASMTKKLDDYLYEQSEMIEPKESKPPRPKTKLPDKSWKSPGLVTKKIV